MIAALWRRMLCALGQHEWLMRGSYRRICKHCPRVEILLPGEGWVEGP